MCGWPGILDLSVTVSDHNDPLKCIALALHCIPNLGPITLTQF